MKRAGKFLSVFLSAVMLVTANPAALAALEEPEGYSEEVWFEEAAEDGAISEENDAAGEYVFEDVSEYPEDDFVVEPDNTDGDFDVIVGEADPEETIVFEDEPEAEAYSSPETAEDAVWVITEDTENDEFLVGADDELLESEYDYAGEAALGTTSLTLNGRGVFVRFTPEETGKYSIYSTCDYEQDSKDTYGHLYLGNEIVIEDDDSGADNNFRMEAELEAGVTYAIVARFYDASATGNIDLHIERSVAVTFDANGGEFYEGETSRILQVAESDDIMELIVPYMGDPLLSFDGWSRNPDGTDRIYSASELSDGDVIYAVYEPRYTDGGSVTLSNGAAVEVDAHGVYVSFIPEESGRYAIISAGDENELDIYYSLYCDNESIGADFSGENGLARMFYDFEAGRTYRICLQLNEDETAVIEKNVYIERAVSVTLDANGGTFYNGENTVRIDNISASVDPSLAISEWIPDCDSSLKQFDGWSKTPDGAVLISDYSDLSDGDVLYAVYSSSYEEGGTITEGEVKTVEINGKPVKVTFTPAETGFYSIYSTCDYSGQAAHDTYGELYQGGSRLTYNDDGGAENNFRIDRELEAGTAYDIIVRFYNDNDSGMLDLHVEKVQTVTVTFDLNGGTATDPNTGEAVPVYTETIARDRAEYFENFYAFSSLSMEAPEGSGDNVRFDGWSYDPEGSSLVSGEDYPEDGDTVYAVWTLMCEVRLHYVNTAGDEENYFSGMVRPGESAAGLSYLESDVLKRRPNSSMFIAGWSEDPNTETGLPLDQLFPEGDRTDYYPVWETGLKVTINPNGGSFRNYPGRTERSIYVKPGASAYYGVLKNYVGENLVWPDGSKYVQGWSEDPNAESGTALTKLYPEKAETTYYAVWKDYVKVTYHASDDIGFDPEYTGSESDVYTVKRKRGNKLSTCLIGDEVFRNANEGMVFQYWSLTENGERVSGNMRLREDIDLYPVWEEFIPVTFDPNGGARYDYNEYDEYVPLTGTFKFYYGKNAAVWGNTESERMFHENAGLVFAGWTLNKATEELIDELKVTEPVTLYAVWKSIDSIRAGEPKTVRAGEDGKAYVNFTPEETGEYVITAASSYDDAEPQLEVFLNNQEIYPGLYTEYEDLCRIVIDLEAGETYKLAVRTDSGYSDCDLTFFADRAIAVILDAGEGLLCGEYETMTAKVTAEDAVDVLTVPEPNDSRKKFTGWSRTADGTALISNLSGLAEDDMLYAVYEDRFVNGGTISEGETKTVEVDGKPVWIEFTPAETGLYSIYSTCDYPYQGNTDTYGYLYQGDTELERDDDGGDDVQFWIDYKLTAGVTYGIVARFYNERASGKLDLHVEKSDLITVTFDMNGGTAESPETGRRVNSYAETRSRHGGRIFDYFEMFNDDWDPKAPNGSPSYRLFDGWAYDAAGSRRVEYSDVPEDGMTVYAVWTDMCFVNLYYSAEDYYTDYVRPGENLSSLKNYESKAQKTRTDPSRFIAGWSTEQTAEEGLTLDQIYPAIGVTSYYPVWVTGVKVTINPNGGSFGKYPGRTERSIYVKPGAYAYHGVLKNYVGDNLVWPDGSKYVQGWSEDPNAVTGKALTSLFPDKEETTYYAVWKDKVTVTYHSVSGIGFAPWEEGVDGDVCRKWQKPGTPIYSFVRSSDIFTDIPDHMGLVYWSLTEGGAPVSDYYIITGDIDLYPVWKTLIPVTFDMNGGGYWGWGGPGAQRYKYWTEPYTMNIYEGDLLSDADWMHPSWGKDKEDLREFAGWSLTRDGEVITGDYPITKEMTFYAVWRKIYRIDFYTGRPGEVFHMNVTEDTFMKDFKRWVSVLSDNRVLDYISADEAGADRVTETFAFDRDMNLYGHYKTIYHVALDANGGYFSIPEETVYRTETEAGKPIPYLPSDTPTYLDPAASKVFAGWALTRGAQEPEIEDLSTYVPEGDVTIYAVYKLCTHVEEIIPAADPTCEHNGHTEGKRCSVCGKILVEPEVIPALIDVATAEVTGISDKTYTGKAITQTPVVTVNGAALAKDTDYTVSFANNINAGTATVTITGIGRCGGTNVLTFKINQAAQSLTVTPANAAVSVGKTQKITVSGNKGKVSYATSSTTIATVSSTGVITAKKVGNAKITVTAAATTNYKKATKTIAVKVVPAATSSLTAANVSGGVKLTWKRVTGANGYKIYRGSKLIKTITSGATLTYTDTGAKTNGAKYTFKVVAKAATGDSKLSKSVTTYFVSRPAISSLSNATAGRLTAKWAKNAKASGYQIQYSTSSKFTSKKTVTVAGAAKVSKVLTGLTKGKTYYVRMRTYKKVGTKNYYSAYSASKKAKVK